MANRLIGVPEGFLRRFVVPDEMVEDLLLVSKVPDDSVESLASALEAETGFVDGDRLAQLISEVLEDEAQTAAVGRALTNLRVSVVDRTLRVIEEWRESEPANAEQFPPDQLKDLREKLPRLIRDYPGLKRFRKARHLATITGNWAREIEAICDLRPVFDQERQRVEGLLALTVLKLVYERQNEEEEVVELMFSAEMLDDLIDKAQKARSKLEILGDSVEAWLPEGFVKYNT